MSNIDKQALRNRYSEKPAPKCHICGSVMTIQRAGAGGVVYGCTGRIDKDGEGYKFADGRDFADDHYARSRVTVADESDPDVLALLDELEDKNREISVWRKRCENAEKGSDLLQRRNAELEAREVTLPPTIWYEHDDLSRDIPVLDKRLVKKALREAGVKVAAAAGKGE